jgi:hypothetical protein
VAKTGNQSTECLHSKGIFIKKRKEKEKQKEKEKKEKIFEK